MRLDLKENLYKDIINKIINIPPELGINQNLSSIIKKIPNFYNVGILYMIKEIFSILLFPYIWVKLILNAGDVIKFFKSYSKNIEGIGTIYSLSYMNIQSYRCIKEKNFNMNETSINDRKFVNSFIYYNVSFILYRIKKVFKYFIFFIFRIISIMR